MDGALFSGLIWNSVSTICDVICCKQIVDDAETFSYLIMQEALSHSTSPF